MGKQEQLMIAPCMGSWTGLVDSESMTKWVEGRLSLWATPEQNKELENKLKAVYEEYLEEISSCNNGNY